MENEHSHESISTPRNKAAASDRGVGEHYCPKEPLSRMGSIDGSAWHRGTAGEARHSERR
eukprot:scaffold126320_cov32-Tisochrysis_lutea.AAC.1